MYTGSVIKIEASKYMNRRELAEYLGISQQSVQNFAKRGELPQGIKIGDCRRWNIAEVDFYLKNKKEGNRNG